MSWAAESMRMAWEAHEAGYNAAKSGRSKEANPHQSHKGGLMHSHWDEGWDHAKSGSPCIDCPVS